SWRAGRLADHIHICSAWCRAIHDGRGCCVSLKTLPHETLPWQQPIKAQESFQLQAVKGTNDCGVCVRHSCCQIEGIPNEDMHAAVSCRHDSHGSMCAPQLFTLGTES